ncbi:MAG: TniQ family protein [Firmicutes bacterium]|nr:TniQ family protein [Bacillota bacterium]
MKNTFLTKIKPVEGESLTSYMQRTAKANYITAHELWRFFTPIEKRYPQTSMSWLIDYVPSTLIDLDKMSEYLNLTQDELVRMSFKVVLNKFYPPNSNDRKLSSSRILSGLLEQQSRRYCPECLKDNCIYKLLWQVKEIKYCDKHNIKLKSICPKCNKKIPLMDVNSKVGTCSKCGTLFSANYLYDKSKLNNHDYRCIDDWSYFFSEGCSLIDLSNEVGYKQQIPLKLLYIVNDFQTELNMDNIYNKGLDKSLQQLLLQTARHTRSKDQCLSIKVLLEIVRSLSIGFTDFAEIKVPLSFKESVYRNVTLKEKYSCVAPWCNSYNAPGSLKRTSTSVKSLEDGRKFKYYLYCQDCSTQYAIDYYTNILVERGYFIELAWDKVKQLLNGEHTLAKISSILGETKDRVKRSIIFLATNNLVDRKNVCIHVPESDEEIKVLTLINRIKKESGSIKNIWRELGWNYNEFLYYWFKPEVQLVYINRKIANPQKRVDKSIMHKKVIKILTNYLEIDSTITIENIAKELSVCHETLRRHGTLPIIKEFKEGQKKARFNREKQVLLSEIKNIYECLSRRGHSITSTKIYEELGQSRNAIYKRHPEVTNFVTKLVKPNNRC